MIPLLATAACLAAACTPQDARPAAPAPATPAADAPAARAIEVELRGAEDLPLFGTLCLPAEVPERGAPALVLLPGSGPTDRDGNQPPYLVTDLLKQIAVRLADAGVASLRCDKRSAARYHQDLVRMGGDVQAEFFAWERFVGDAAAALAFLRARPEIDAARTGLLGHSEGGLIALELARERAADAPCAALVLVSTAGTDMTELLRYQIGRIIAPYPEPVREKLMAELERVCAAVVASGAVPDDVPPGLQALFPKNAAQLLQVELALDPAELARAVPGPVLVLHGEHDAQVPADPHASRLEAALKERERGRCDVVIVPGASHNLKPVKSADQAGFAGDVAPQALDGLVSWLHVHLAK